MDVLARSGKRCPLAPETMPPAGTQRCQACHAWKPRLPRRLWRAHAGLHGGRCCKDLREQRPAAAALRRVWLGEVLHKGGTWAVGVRGLSRPLPRRIILAILGWLLTCCQGIGFPGTGSGGCKLSDQYGAKPRAFWGLKNRLVSRRQGVCVAAAYAGLRPQTPADALSVKPVIPRGLEPPRENAPSRLGHVGA